MARRKTAAAEPIPTEEPQMQEAATDTAAAEPTADGTAPRQDHFVFKTVNVDGTRIQFQDSRHPGQPWEFQIRFGDGTRDDMPSEGVRDYIKSHKITVETREGPKEVNLFHWNAPDGAWGMRIPFDPQATLEENRDAREDARQTAKAVFDGVVEMVRGERRAARQQMANDLPDGAAERVKEERGAVREL